MEERKKSEFILHLPRQEEVGIGDDVREDNGVEGWRKYHIGQVSAHVERFWALNHRRGNHQTS